MLSSFHTRCFLFLLCLAFNFHTLNGQKEYHFLFELNESKNFAKGLPNEDIDYHKIRYKRESSNKTRANQQRYSIKDGQIQTLGNKEYKYAKLQSKHKIIVQGLDDLFGVIDTLFNPIIPTEYDDIYQFWNNAAWLLKQNKKWSLVDSNFISVANEKFDQVYILSDEYFIARIDRNTVLCNIKKGMIKDFGSGIYFKSFFTENPQYLFIHEKLKHRKYLCNNQGKDILELKDGDRVSRFASKINAFKLRRNRKTGLVSENGDLIIPNMYRNITGLKYTNSYNDLFFTPYIKGKYALYQNRDSILVSDNEIYGSSRPHYMYLRAPKNRKNKYYIFTKEGKKGFYNYESGYISEPVYDEIIQWEDDKIAVQKNGLFGVIDSLENTIIPVEYTEISLGQKNVVVVKDSLYALLDLSGKTLMPLHYQWLTKLEKDYSGRIQLGRFKRDGKTGFYDENFEEILSPALEGAIRFKSSLASVKIDDKWGFIDKEGKLVIPAIYDTQTHFDENETAQVQLNGKLFYINKSGDCIKGCD